MPLVVTHKRARLPLAAAAAAVFASPAWAAVGIVAPAAGARAGSGVPVAAPLGSGNHGGLKHAAQPLRMPLLTGGLPRISSPLRSSDSGVFPSAVPARLTRIIRPSANPVPTAAMRVGGLAAMTAGIAVGRRTELREPHAVASPRESFRNNSAALKKIMARMSGRLRHVSPFDPELPEPSLDRLEDLTDENGIFEHASSQDPAKCHGYCTEDVARALTAVLMYRQQGYGGEESAAKLSRTYLTYLRRNQGADGRFRHRMDSEGRLSSRFVTEDAYGRALWGLGYATAYPLDEKMREEAAGMMAKALPHGRELRFPRAAAYAVLGLHYYLKRVPDSKEARELLITLSDSLVARFSENSSRAWAWFEDEMTYDNAKLPQALLAAYETTGLPIYRRVAERSLDFLIEVSFRRGVLHVIGNKGWYRRNGQRADFDQQPTDAASFVETLALAHRLTGKESYRSLARIAFEWFLGRNALGLPMYDPATGGSRDGLTAIGVNSNQGAESSIMFLIALLTARQLAS